MTEEARRPRIFVLGAGFSAPAGLPIARDLLQCVLDELRPIGQNKHLEGSLEDYVGFIRATRGRAPRVVDIEDFATYLDHEHVFNMRGSDTWSEDGNRAQLQLRWGIRTGPS